MMNTHLTRKGHYFLTYHSLNFWWRIGHFKLSTINSPLSAVSKSLLCGAFAEKLRDVEVYKIGVMKND